jgi:hypothetical protein
MTRIFSRLATPVDGGSPATEAGGRTASSSRADQVCGVKRSLSRNDSDVYPHLDEKLPW